MNRLILIFAFCLSQFLTLSAQLQVVNNGDALTLAQTIMGEGVKIVDGSATLRSSNGATGLFTNTNTEIPFSDGIIFSTGLAVNAVGPNDDNSKTRTLQFERYDDPDMTAINPDANRDVTVLEFEFIPSCNYLELSFVFASEEYMEFVENNINKNDAFGFFITGPNPQGGQYVGQNLAVVPGTTDPITVQTVNPNVNGEYYIDNPTYDPNTQTGGANIQYDGFTKPIAARLNVVACETYRIKLILCDTDDTVVDSAIFLEKGGLNCSQNSISINTTGDFFTEGCTAPTIRIGREGHLGEELLVDLSYSGVATHPDDFTGPTTITIPAQSADVVVPLESISDGLTEGEETFTLTATFQLCDEDFTVTHDFTIRDEVVASAGEDVSTCSNTTTLDAELPAGFSGSWTIPANTSINDDLEADAAVTLNTTGEYTFIWTIDDGNGCTDSDEVTINYSNSLAVTSTSITQPSCDGVCDGAIQIVMGQAAALYSVNWPGGTNLANNLQATDLCSGDYNLTITENSTQCSTDLTLSLEDPLPLALSTNPSTGSAVCANEQINISTSISGGTGAISYTWTQDNSDVNGNESLSAQINANSTITVQATDENGCQSEIVSLSYTMAPVIQLQIAQHPTEVCFDDCIPLEAIISGGSGQNQSVNWDINGQTQKGENIEVCIDEVKNIQVSAEDHCQQPATEALTISPFPSPSMSLATATTGCAPYDECLALTSDMAIQNLQWTTSSGTGNYDAANEEYCLQITEEGSHDISLTVDYGNNCSFTQNFNNHIEVTAAPDAFFDLADNQISLGDPTISITNQSTGGERYEWTIGDVTYDDVPTYWNGGAGTYQVTLTAYADDNCMSEYSEPITFMDAFTFYIPTAFTPAEYGHNQGFGPVVQVSEFTGEYSMLIYNRWGNLLFETTDIHEKWDGTVAGKPLPIGSYIYYITLTTPDRNFYEYTGAVNLLK